MKWDTQEYFVEIVGQDGGYWLRPERFWRNDIERAQKGY
jgi:hypothetical protein